MAAVLCESISKMCSAMCTGVKTVLCLPCEVCGFTCDFITDVCRSDFCAYLTVTIVFNLPPVIYTFSTLFSQEVYINDGGCNSMLMQWLTLHCILCGINILAAIYISKRISDVSHTNPFVEDKNDVERGGGGGVAAVVTDDYKKSQEDGTMMTATVMDHGFMSSRGSITRVKEVLCYDPFVAGYILILIGFFIWLTNGTSRLAESHDEYGDACSDVLRGHVKSSIYLGFVFLTLGGVALGLSLICSMSRTNFRRY